MTTISIITISYNAEAVIFPTLQSVEAQTYPYIEYLVIDGASSDGTVSLVKRISSKAKIISEPDRGIYDAMNKGLCLAKGDYIWFLNAGDSLPTPQTVAEVVSLIESKEPQPDIIYGDTMIVNAQRKELHLRRLRPPRNLTKAHFINGMLVCHQAFIVRKDIVLPYDLRYKLSADYDWCLRMLERSQSTQQIDAVIAHYLEGGISQKRHWESLRERFTIMRNHFGLLPTIGKHVSFLFIHSR